MAITFTPDSVRAAGLTGRDAVYLEAARVARGYTRDIVTAARRVTDEDGDGAVDLPFGPRLPLHSVWIAVDLASGASTVASPHPDGPAHSVEKLRMGEIQQLTREGEYWMFLLVRPGVGAWTLIVADSGIEDDDRTRADRKVKLTIGRMTALGASPAAPQHLKPSDVLFMIDPLNLTVVELRNE